jgi:hypothetical protein
MAQPPEQHPDRSAAATNTLADALAPFWSAAKVQTELGLDEDRLTADLTASRVLGLVTSDGVWVFPVAQFERVDGTVRVKPSIRAMLAELAGTDGWSVGLLLTTEAPELGGKSPYDAERAGTAVDELVEYARLVRREWAN